MVVWSAEYAVPGEGEVMASVTFGDLLRDEIVKLLPDAEVVSTHEVAKCSMLTTVRVGRRQVKNSLTHLEILRRGDSRNGWYELAEETAKYFVALLG